MQFFRRLAKPVSLTVTAGMLALSLHLPAANAAMVSTETVMHSVQAQQEINRIHEALNRDEVKVQLAELGVDQALVQARVDALSDEEAQQLATQLDEMPAGSGVIGALLFIFVVLLVTDLLGLTDVFPFTKKGSARR
jgi:hypothetical protein